MNNSTIERAFIVYSSIKERPPGKNNDPTANSWTKEKIIKANKMMQNNLIQHGQIHSNLSQSTIFL
jgi:hypothetical protein